MNSTEAGLGGSIPRLRRADHAGRAYDEDIATCRRVINERDGLHYIAHVTSGLVDFAFDFPGRWPRGQDAAETSERAGRQLSLAVAELDLACEPLDSGALIRVVVQGENGALFQVLKVPSQTFFGMTLDGEPDIVDQADRQMGRLTELAARRDVAAALLRVGFGSREDSNELRSSHKAGLPARLSGRSDAVVSSEGSIIDSVAQACREALHRDDLHYLGVFRRGQLTWRVDIFDDPALAPFFQRVTPWSRRRNYDRLIRQVNLQVRRLRHLLVLVSSHQLIRLVLDVAHGAIYVLPLSGDEYLVGVTLTRSQAEQADRKMIALYKSVRSATDAGAAADRQ